MNQTNRIGLIVVVVSTFVVIVLFGVYIGIKRIFFTEDRQEIVSEIEAIPQADPREQDTDNDGLPDLIENIYRSDPTIADTDGDGTIDGDEILVQRDPTISGPNDFFEAPDLIPSDSFDPNSFTQQYIATLPTDAVREEVLDEDRLESFITEKVKEFLPETTSGSALDTTSESTVEEINAYLESISASHNTEVVSVTSEQIERAFSTSLQAQNTNELTSIVAGLQKNITIFESVTPPEEVANLHAKLIATTQSLLEATQLLSAVGSDFIGGLIGAKIIEDLGPLFTEIASDVAALEAKYNLE